MSKYKNLIISLSLIIVLFFFGSSLILQKNYVVPILMYHSITPDAIPEKRLTVSVESFGRQMSFLKRNNYNVLPLEGLISLIKYRRKVPPKTVALTFDDGYKDNYTYAFPVLKKYKFPATVFIIVNEVARPQKDRLNWQEIQEMQESGLITIGSHCLGPKVLTDLKLSEAKEEIFKSKRILEEKLGKQVNIFSYPAGRFNSEIRQLVIDAGYKMAVTTHPGKHYPDDDLFALKRMRISSTSDRLFIFWIESSGFYNLFREYRHK